MLVKDIPYHLRHTVTELKAPIFLEPVEHGWRAGVEPDLQLTLWLLGFLENQDREVRLYASGAQKELLAAHPLVKSLDGQAAMPGRVTAGLIRPRPTHCFLLSSHHYAKQVPVAPLDQLRASPAEANLGFYGLPLKNDSPGFPRSLIRSRLANDALSSGGDCSVLFPWGFWGGVERWWDPVWWNTLAYRLKKQGPVIVLGPPELNGAIGLADRFLALETPSPDISGLGELAGLFAGAARMAGRGGGMGCLASAVGGRMVLVWDSLLAYRHWSSPNAGHVVLTNPYALRYPQTMRRDKDRLWEDYLKAEGKDTAEAGSAPQKDGVQKERFEAFCRNKELAGLAFMELRNLQDWLGKKELRELFYSQSLGYAASRLLQDGEAAGAWLAPVAP